MSTVLENFLNTREAAAVIGCTDAHVRRMLLDGTLTGKKVSARSWMIRRRDAERIRDEPAATGRPRKNSI
jgi:hypothetical protein